MGPVQFYPPLLLSKLLNLKLCLNLLLCRFEYLKNFAISLCEYYSYLNIKTLKWNRIDLSFTIPRRISFLLEWPWQNVHGGRSFFIALVFIYPNFLLILGFHLTWLSSFWPFPALATKNDQIIFLLSIFKMLMINTIPILYCY